MATDTLHVVHMIDFLGQGGAQEIVKLILTKGTAPDMRYTVIALTSQQKELYYEKYRSAGAEVIFLSSPWGLGPYIYFPLLCFRARKWLKQLKPDILHMHLQGSMMVGCVSSLGLPVKRILNCYAWPSQVEFWVYPMMRLFASIISRIQFLSREAMSWLPENKFIQAYAGVDLDIDFGLEAKKVREEFCVSEDKICFFSVGRFHSDKGHASAIRVFAGIQRECPRSVLFVIGDGPKKEWKKLRAVVSECGIEQSVKFTGYRNDLPSFFGNGGFYLRTSVNEPGNMTNILAQYAGLVSVGFCVKSVNRSEIDFIENGVTGALVPLNDFRAMQEAILQLIADPSARKRIGEASRDFIIRHRNIEKVMVEPFVASYRVLSKKEGKG